MNNGRIMDEIIICSRGRCSSWGKHWKRHWYDKETEECYRCGMSRKEQFEEDKYCGLVTGSYKPIAPKESEISK